MAKVSIQLLGVSKRFDHTVKGEVYAVRDVNLAVAEGELLTLLGPSGCGKSTTLRMIAGFEEPDAGTISIDGKDVTHVLPNRRGIGFVFQNYALFPHLSVFENVAYALRVQGKDDVSIKRAVTDVLEVVGLANYENQQPHQMSGGEQQRVALARAFVTHPAILFADEPTGSLDAATGHAVIDLMFEMNRANGATLILVTHDIELARRCDKTVTIEAGRLA
jgi:ABC-type Fe3+/spermidine/putrescine transport system ATPase subunit